MINPQPNTNLLLNGDSLEVLKEMPDNILDAVVTDPPYGLSFMSKKWDYDVPSVELWKEVFRVMKPGAFLLSFAGTRTYHRMAVNIEDAGFEIRDMISWLYGSGFPKSLNIGKQVDKIEGNEREDLGRHPQPGKSGKTHTRDGGAFKDNIHITKGTSPWEGWGTALKPACEPIVVARKPLGEKNVASNVLKWGTGGINIDGCRVGFKNEDDYNESTKKNQHKDFDSKPVTNNVVYGDYSMMKPKNYAPQGRFPANIILDEEAGKILDEQTEGKVGNGHWAKTKVTGFGEFGNGKSEYFGVGKKDNDKGGASRFFYCAKASKSERNLGCEEMPLKHYLAENKMGGEKDTMLTGSGNPRDCRKHNFHPTVKPIKLMRYLVRLVTKKGGLVLDPFLGSGTTACACIKEGMNYIGIERDEEYMNIIKARIKAHEESK